MNSFKVERHLEIIFGVIQLKSGRFYDRDRLGLHRTDWFFPYNNFFLKHPMVHGTTLKVSPLGGSLKYLTKLDRKDKSFVKILYNIIALIRR